MKIFNFCLLILCLLSSQLMAQEDDSSDSRFDFLNVSDSVKVNKRFRVMESVSLLGFNSYFSEEGSGLKMPTHLDFLDQRIGRSIQYGLGVVDFRLGLNGKDKPQKLGLMAGVRLNLSYYHFKRDFRLIGGADTFEEAIIVEDNEVKKNRLLGSYVSIPLMLDFKANPIKSLKSFKFSVGYVHSFLLRGNYKLKFKDKDLAKIKIKDDFNLNQSLGKIEARIGYGPVVLYMQYGLDSLFATDKGPNVTPISFGLVTGG